jgi:putative zinc finger/helix-turn-helix YgiT family protein
MPAVWQPWNGRNERRLSLCRERTEECRAAGITLHKCRKCGELLPEIPSIKKLHAKIALELLYKEGPLTGEEIRFLRKEMRLKANELAALLGVHKVMVSRWENNNEKIGPSSDRLLWYIYAMRRIEELAAHLGELGSNGSVRCSGRSMVKALALKASMRK